MNMENSKKIEWVLRIAVAGEFVGHSVFALQGKKAWIDWIQPAHWRGNRHSGNYPDAHRSIGFACCAHYLSTPNPRGCFMGGVLGILDRSGASGGRRTGLGLCGALGKLGRAACSAIASWLAEKLERVVQ